MSYCSENVLEEMENCYNITKCFSTPKHGFISKKLRNLAKIVKPFLRKLISSKSKLNDCDANIAADNYFNETKAYEEQNSLNERLEEQYDNAINEALEQQQHQQQQQDIRVIAITPDGQTFAIPFTLLPWAADYDICLRDDVYTITKDQTPELQVPC